jgi:dTDP-4-dehydrorhamnose reductase
MKKIIIIGSGGMAGHVMFNFFKEKTSFQTIGIARSSGIGNKVTYQLDVTSFDSLRAIIARENPDVVINCVGILNKDAEDNPDKAILLNSYFPHFLARMGNERSFKLIHISTDCVFDGKTGGYTEKSEKTGKGYYAKTKALGEVEYDNHLTLRTSIIGPELKKNGIGLFDWFMKQRGNIKGYRQAYWTGVTTIELAKAVEEAIKQDISGLHHLVNDQKINKYDLITLFKDIFKKTDVKIDPLDDYKVDKSLLKTNHDFAYIVPSYKAMILSMKEWIENHDQLYNFKPE